LGDVTEMIDTVRSFETKAFHGRIRSKTLMEDYGTLFDRRSHPIDLTWATGANDFR
jgi:hypothetical protein